MKQLIHRLSLMLTSIKAYPKFLLPMFCAAVIGSGRVIAQEQEYKSFKLVERELIWQQVYDSALTDSDCLAFFEQLSTTSNSATSSDCLLLDVNDLRVDYVKYGKTMAGTATVVTDYALSGKLKVERKENKYRVTFYGIQSWPIVLNNSLLQRADFGYHMLKDKRDKIRASCANEEVLGLYNKFLFDYFHVKTPPHGNDW